MKYTDLIQQSKEDAEKALAPAKADEQKAALGLEIGKLELEVKKARTSLDSKKGEYPLPVDEILEAGDSLALDERRLNQLKLLSSELFG